MTEPHPSSDSCPFCAIAHSYAPHPTTTTTTTTSLSLPSRPSPSSPSQTSQPSPSSNPFPHTNNTPNTYLLLSTPLVLAFLDIMPITRGHVLVATRAHRPKLSDVTVAEARALGVWVGVVSRAVVRALGEGEGEGEGDHGDGEAGAMGDWNVVQNNGARAAQVVPHVHFHIIPRPGDVPNIEHKSWTVFGKGQREELDEEDAEGLVRRMREELGREVRRVREREGVDLLDLNGEVGVAVGVGEVGEGRVMREKL